MDNSEQNAQNVIAMSDFQPETGYAAIAQVEAYWEALRGAHTVPRRSDIDARGIESALSNSFILERIGPGMARMRIVGTHLNDLIGMEARGMPLTSFFTPANRQTVSDLLEGVFQTPAVGKLRLVAEASARRPQLEGRMILLPLRSDLGDVSRALGCLVIRGDLGDAPRRFDICERSERPLPMIPAQQPAPTPPEPNAPSTAASGLAEDATEFNGKPLRSRGTHLRLVKSDD